MMINILTFVISYLIASISPSIIISKKVLKTDIRNLGSKNAGTTNAIRTMGKKMGALVFVLDLLKAVIAYLIVLAIAKLTHFELTSVTKSLYVLGLVLGHSYPIYYGFKGGKGVAVLLMSVLLVNPKLALIILGISLVIIVVTRYVSLGSIVGVILLFILNIFMGRTFNIFITLLISAVVVFNHRENIKRLIAGNENKLF